jgi:hypothetical protein
MEERKIDKELEKNVERNGNGIIEELFRNLP